MRVRTIIEDDCQAILDDLAPMLDAMAGTTLLVTGASGFLCSYLLDSVAAWNALGRGAPCHVIAVDNFKTGLSKRIAHLTRNSHVTLQTHDIAEPLKVNGRVDWIVHGASIASPSVYRQFPLETIDANVAGTRNLLELARSQVVRSMVFMSTSEIYGDPDPAHIPTQEDYRGYVSCTGPRACYDESKRLAETLCMTYYRLYGIPVKMIRPFNVYGPGLRLDDRRVLPDYCDAVLKREPIRILSDGSPTRAFAYVSDVIRGILRVLLSDHDGEAFNVGNDEEEISMYQLALRVSKVRSEVLGGEASEVIRQKSADPDYLTDTPQRRCADLTKLRSLSGWAPNVSRHEGLRRTLCWYRDQALGQRTGKPLGGELPPRLQWQAAGRVAHPPGVLHAHGSQVPTGAGA